MPKPPVKSSVYAEFIYQKVDEYFLKKGSAFTVAEFAAWAGLKPTGNMRRRLRHAVASGTLAVTTAYMSDKGRGNVYYQPSKVAPMDLPF